jgi:hypothetical protein
MKFLFSQGIFIGNIISQKNIMADSVSFKFRGVAFGVILEAFIVRRCEERSDEAISEPGYWRSLSGVTGVPPVNPFKLKNKPPA